MKIILLNLKKKIVHLNKLFLFLKLILQTNQNTKRLNLKNFVNMKNLNKNMNFRKYNTLIGLIVGLIY
jgi:hypothetical protein